jgi:hypothetical protein
MMSQLPVIVGVVAIVVLTVVQGLMTDRLVDTNVTAEQRAQLLKDVPKEFGEWTSKDLEVTEEVRDTSGAVGCVSRAYRNSRTGDTVRLWIIVGHARAIGAHTPDICYRGSGFTMRSPISSLYSFEYEGRKEKADFWTNTFIKEDSLSGRHLVRVFWAWYNPKPGKPIVWQAERDPFAAFGNTRALFKMYFSSDMRDLNETTEESPAMKFGKEFLPKIEQVLLNSTIRAPNDSTTGSETQATGTESSQK